MRRILTCLALTAVVALVACSGDSPKPSALPTPAANTWQITSLSVSDATPFVGSSIAVTASASLNGGAPPDGTMVEFVASGGVFFSTSGTQAQVATEGGTATAFFAASAAGDYAIQARAGDASRQVVVSYREHEVSDQLQIYLPLVPSMGSADGGEQVVLNGKGIARPVDVFFTVGGVQYQAVVTGVDESEPLSSDGSITIVTPPITEGDAAVDRTADVLVNTGVGTADEQTTTLRSAFTFKSFSNPEIYVLIPSEGSPRGGQQVTILGTNLQGTSRVTFGDREAQEVAVSPDGSQISVITPQYSAAPLEEDVSVAVTAYAGAAEATKTDAFVFKADAPTPVINALEPIAGPLDGGTRVTIFGTGFQFPAQVTFGNLEADVVNVFDNKVSVDATDTIICITPDYSQQGQTPPVAVNVVVTNIDTGKSSNTATFTYGDLLYISGNNPSEGRLDDLISIYGSGFEDPLKVTFANIDMDVKAISGTEIVVGFPDNTAPVCNQVTGTFTVSLLESNRSATGGSFTLLGNKPLVTGVEPAIVQSQDLDNDDPDHVEESVNPSTVTVRGQGFQETATIAVNTLVLGAGEYSVEDDSTIAINNLPTAQDLGLVWNTSTCTTDTGVVGQRRVATPVDVTVTNYPGGCSDTLSGAIVYQPDYTECVAGPAISVTPNQLDFALDAVATVDGSICEPTQNVTIENIGGEPVTLSYTAPADFSVVLGTNLLPGTGDTTTATIEWCPTSVGPVVDSITFSAAGGNSVDVTITGQAVAEPVLDVDPLSFDFGTTAGSFDFTVTNLGFADLNWTASETTDPDSVFSLTGSTSGTLASGASEPLQVSFTLAGAPATHSGSVTVDDPAAVNSPVVLTLSAETP
jgi:hypothetical protein